MIQTKNKDLAESYFGVLETVFNKIIEGPSTVYMSIGHSWANGYTFMEATYHISVNYKEGL